MSRVWAVIAGGGTAGHVLPGISIADEMTRRGVPAEDVRFLAGARGAEAAPGAAAGPGVPPAPG
ncbi:MAG: glycosyltransferase, partial [Acidimicrobiaceae bacterium]|nr:glycosyltransferase [Acidimicrobiaceae bacterium]